jgi:hypothetical protein
MFQEEKCTGISREKETLTTQVVRKSHLKKRRKASSRVNNQNCQRGREEDQRKKKVQP